MKDNMTMMEKMKYTPSIGDVLIYLDGSNYQVERVVKTHIKLTQSGSAEEIPLRPIAHVRADLIKNECFICRKTDKN